MIIPFRKDPLSLFSSLNMNAMSSGQQPSHTKPEEKPSTTETRSFRKAKTRRKQAQASRRRNRK